MLIAEDFTLVELPLDQPRTVWVAMLPVHVPKLEGIRWLAIQLNAPTWEAATEVDYLLTNAPAQQVSATWFAQTYSQRNWVVVRQEVIEG